MQIQSRLRQAKLVDVRRPFAIGHHATARPSSANSADVDKISSDRSDVTIRCQRRPCHHPPGSGTGRAYVDSTSTDCRPAVHRSAEISVDAVVTRAMPSPLTVETIFKQGLWERMPGEAVIAQRSPAGKPEFPQPASNESAPISHRIDQSSSINGVFDLTSHVAMLVVIGVKQPLIGVAGCDCGELPIRFSTLSACPNMLVR